MKITLWGKKTQYLVFSEGEFDFSSFEFQKRTWLVALRRETQEQGCFCTLLRLRLKSPLINGTFFKSDQKQTVSVCCYFITKTPLRIAKNILFDL